MFCQNSTEHFFGAERSVLTEHLDPMFPRTLNVNQTQGRFDRTAQHSHAHKKMRADSTFIYKLILLKYHSKVHFTLYLKNLIRI